MTQRRHHYEVAFEEFLRLRRTPYVAVDEARKALLPEGAALMVREDEPGGSSRACAIKSFDFVIYGSGMNLLIEVKGRRVSWRGSGKAGAPLHAPPGAAAAQRPRRGRLESWVTIDDIESLSRWEVLFGPEFEAAFVFVYWCEVQPPDALFQEVFAHRDRWYALRAVTLREYRQAMKVRSTRWRTVDVAPSVFERISMPFAPDAVMNAASAVRHRSLDADAHLPPPPLPLVDQLLP
jgi:hypothetical protein